MQEKTTPHVPSRGAAGPSCDKNRYGWEILSCLSGKKCFTRCHGFQLSGAVTSLRAQLSEFVGRMSSVPIHPPVLMCLEGLDQSFRSAVWLTRLALPKGGHLASVFSLSQNVYFPGRHKGLYFHGAETGLVIVPAGTATDAPTIRSTEIKGRKTRYRLRSCKSESRLRHRIKIHYALQALSLRSIPAGCTRNPSSPVKSCMCTAFK